MSVEACPNAAPQANAQTNALIHAPAATNLLITPPREFYLCSR